MSIPNEKALPHFNATVRVKHELASVTGQIARELEQQADHLAKGETVSYARSVVRVAELQETAQALTNASRAMLDVVGAHDPRWHGNVTDDVRRAAQHSNTPRISAPGNN